jgi:hypothetical protein
MKRPSDSVTSANTPRLTPEAQKAAEEQYRLSIKAYEEVGRGISTWAALEMRLVQIASILLGAPERKTGLILYSINNFYSWLSIIDGLFADSPQHEKPREQWSKLASDLKAQNDIRVRLAHQSLFLDVFEAADGKIKTELAGLRPSPFDSRAKSKGLEPLTTDEIIAFREIVCRLYEKLSGVYSSMLPQQSSPENCPE